MRLHRLFLPTFAVVFSIGYFFDTYSLPFSSTLYPRILIVLLLGLSVYELWKELHDASPETEEEKMPNRQILSKIGAVIILSVAYALTVERMGFLLATPVLVFFMLLVWRVTAWKSILMAICTTAAFYTVFVKFLLLPL